MDIADHVADMAEEAVGNWQRFESFGWHSAPDDAEAWAIVYTSNRDSGLLDKANEKAIAEAMEPFLGGDAKMESHNHWAVGYVDGYSIRVYDAKGEVTKAFSTWAELCLALEDYPVPDEDLYCEMEYEATLENIEMAASRFVSDDAPDDWAGELFSWFWEHDPGAVENTDGHGGYPSDDECKAGLAALGWLDPEYMDDDEGEE